MAIVGLDDTVQGDGVSRRLAVNGVEPRAECGCVIRSGFIAVVAETARTGTHQAGQVGAAGTAGVERGAPSGAGGKAV